MDQRILARAGMGVAAAMIYPATLADDRCFDRQGRRMVTGTFEQAGERVIIVATEASTAEPAGLAAALAAAGAEVGASATAVADVYVQAGSAALSGAHDLGARIVGALATVALPDGLRRLTVSVPAAAMQMVRSTFERASTGFAENQDLRDLHPMVAERLHLWRLAQFDLRRLPAPDDVYLFEATAPASADDRRLVALAEVHDLTPLRNAAGSVTAIPALEQVLDSCLDG